MDYLTADADDAESNNTENNDETAINSRIDLFDTAALIMGPKNVIGHILENGEVPENSPLRDEHNRLQDVQKKNYNARVNNYDISLPEYLEKMGWPDCEEVVDPDKFRDDGLKVHPDYSDDGRCYADPPANHDGYPIAEDYDFPAFYPESDDSGEDESQDTATEGSGEQPLTGISGIGEKTAEKIEDEWGISNLREARHHDPVDPDDLPGVGERTLRKLHISIAENDGDGEDNDDPDNGFTFDADDDGDAVEDSNDGDIPDFIRENPEVLADLSPEQIEALVA